jgi:hypothetical protein
MIVPIPEDIYCYEHKVWGNFTKRQLICGTAALTVIFPIFIPVFLRTENPRLAALVSMFAALPILLCGIWKRDGQYIDKIIWYKFRQRFKFPQKRKFVMINLYEIIQKEYERAHEKATDKDTEKKKGYFKHIISMGQKRHGTK